MNKEYNIQLDKLCEHLGLGKLIGDPEQVFGGHLHRMYAVSAFSGKYAVKALNPQVMLRPEAWQNMINSELVAQTAVKCVPALPAKILKNNFLHKFDGQYYMLFDWIEGRSIFADELSTDHCNKIGRVLAGIHKIDFRKLAFDDRMYHEESLIDWNFYLQLSEKQNESWAVLFSENIDFLYEKNNSLISAAARLDKNVVISHCDLEPKNVIWQEDKPIVIDWEAAGVIHPMHDLLETALYWSENNSNIDKNKFVSFVEGYRDVVDKIDSDWCAIFDKGWGAKLGWLEYSLKRSLGIECSGEDEKKVGSEHVFGTIKMLHEYEGMREQIISLMAENSF